MQNLQAMKDVGRNDGERSDGRNQLDVDSYLPDADEWEKIKNKFYLLAR